MHRRIIGLEDRAFTPEEAKRWLRLIYMHYFPVNLLGGANQRRLFRRIKILFEQPRYAKAEFQIDDLSSASDWLILKKRRFDWLRASPG